MTAKAAEPPKGGSNKAVGISAHRPSFSPWNLSYAAVDETRPSWSLHGLPALAHEFLDLVLGLGSQSQHLDIGCGNGVKTVAFAQAGLAAVGADQSLDGLSQAAVLAGSARLESRCSFVRANAVALPFKRCSIGSLSDVLMATHLPDQTMTRYCQEIARVLLPGAYVLLVFFSDADEHFHGHPVTRQYSFRFDSANPEMAGYEHYEGMFNFHFSGADIDDFLGRSQLELVSKLLVQHPVYSYRALWNAIGRRKE